MHWPPQDKHWGLYYLEDMWRYTLFWTLLMYTVFHWGAAAIAIIMQIGKRHTNWKYLWTLPILYTLTAGAEALVAGSVTGVMWV